MALVPLLFNLSDADSDGAISREEIMHAVTTAPPDKLEPLWRASCLVLPLAPTYANRADGGVLGRVGWRNWTSCDVHTATYWGRVGADLLAAVAAIGQRSPILTMLTMLTILTILALLTLLTRLTLLTLLTRLTRLTLLTLLMHSLLTLLTPHSHHTDTTPTLH